MLHTFARIDAGTSVAVILPTDCRQGPPMTVLDYAVIAPVRRSGCSAIGRYYARRVQTADDYLLGGRSMSPLMIGLSLFATLTSTLSYLALPGEMIKNGPVVFAEFLSFPFVFVIVGWVLIPRIMRQRVTSGYELLEARLGLTGRLLGALMFVLLRVFWMASILYATADARPDPAARDLDPTLDAGHSASAMAVITLLYTVEGGLKAVVVTDAVQAVLMFLGAVVDHRRRLGGPGRGRRRGGRRRGRRTGRSRWSCRRRARRGRWSGRSVAMLVWMTCTAGSDQMSIQRYLATRDAAAARRSFGIQLLSTVLSMVAARPRRAGGPRLLPGPAGGAEDRVDDRRATRTS